MGVVAVGPGPKQRCPTRSKAPLREIAFSLRVLRKVGVFMTCKDSREGERLSRAVVKVALFEVFRFDLFDLCDAFLVAAAFEVGGKPGSHDLGGLAFGNEAGGEGEDVRVVVLAGEGGDLG